MTTEVPMLWEISLAVPVALSLLPTLQVVAEAMRRFDDCRIKGREFVDYRLDYTKLQLFCATKAGCLAFVNSGPCQLGRGRDCRSIGGAGNCRPSHYSVLSRSTVTFHLDFNPSPCKARCNGIKCTSPPSSSLIRVSARCCSYLY